MKRNKNKYTPPPMCGYTHTHTHTHTDIPALSLLFMIMVGIGIIFKDPQGGTPQGFSLLPLQIVHP